VRHAPTDDPVLAADEWFLQHGLTYFVPEERAAARSALRLRRILPFLVVVVVLASGAGGALAWTADQVSFAPATLLSLVLMAATWYALTALHARPIVGWALTRTFGSLRTLLPMTTRALPMLLLFITFLFINTEVWMVADSLDPGVLALAVMFFATLAVGFLLVRLPEEMDRVDDDIDPGRLAARTSGTPLEDRAAELFADADPAELRRTAEVAGLEKGNLVLVLLVAQTLQVLLLAVAVLLFFLVFGSVVMQDAVVESWIGHEVHGVPGLGGLTAPLLKVSVFLAGFSGLYFTVYAVTDETYRQQFFTSVMRELERAVAVRAVYRNLTR
jgi:hypothetical protein